MTQKQIDAVRERLNKKYYGNECYTQENLLQPWTREDTVLMEEMSCREMINSILIYGGSCEKGGYQYEQYLESYTEKDAKYGCLISKKRLAQLIKEQEEDIRQATIGFAGYDSEGVSYNYCRFADE